MDHRTHLRRSIRQQRRALSSDQQLQAAQQLASQVINQFDISQQQHFALYLANDGELDPAVLIDALWQRDKQVYLPVLDPQHEGYLLFAHYTKDTALSANKFSIPEPQSQHYIDVARLDVIFTPLVAFDSQGNRLGMGGGFYDRTLATLPNDTHCQIIGLAHELQQVDHVPVECWDIPLQTIITPNKVWRF